MQYRMIACVFVKVGVDWYSTPGLEPGWNPDIINQKEEIFLQLAPQVAQESIEPLLDLAPHVKKRGVFEFPVALNGEITRQIERRNDTTRR